MFEASKGAVVTSDNIPAWAWWLWAIACTYMVIDIATDIIDFYNYRRDHAKRQREWIKNDVKLDFVLFTKKLGVWRE